MICWKCKKEIVVEKIARTTECSYCHVDLHCCKNCKFYSTGSHFDCKETIDEVIVDKEKSNFCDYFCVKESVAENDNSASDKARAAAAMLFGDAPVETSNKSAKDAFDALFK